MVFFFLFFFVRFNNKIQCKGDHNYIKGNPKYIATPIYSGNGALAIINYESVGKMPAQMPCLDGHKGPVLDFDFNPFHDNIVATGNKLKNIPTSKMVVC